MDNSTYLSGHYVRSISYISNEQPGSTYNFMVFSTNQDSIYQIAYGPIAGSDPISEEH